MLCKESNYCKYPTFYLNSLSWLDVETKKYLSITKKQEILKEKYKSIEANRK